MISDHKNLKYWTKAHNFTWRQAHWLLWLSRFNLQITHYPGKSMGKSDALTQSTLTEVSDADDNCDQIVLVPRQLHQIASTVIAGPNPVKEQIRECSEKEAEVVAALEKMKRTGLRKLANGAAKWEEADGLVYYREKLYVPNNLEIC